MTTTYPEATEIRRYDFSLRSKGGTRQERSYSYPLFVQDEPDWPAFVERMRATEADHFTLVADAGLPEHLTMAFSTHLAETGIPCSLVMLDASEPGKTLEAARRIATQARAQGGGTHSSYLVSLGGGVVGNLTGFAASVLVRGVRLVHIPTTLLAATDSVLSLKQGVNVRASSGRLVKNLLGSFYAPEFVLIYPSLWESLPEREVSSGLCEVVKNVVGIQPERQEEVMGLLHPEAPYTADERHRLFALCFAAKQAVMREDAHEKGPALILELGHTVGHALESLTGLAHGLAVGLGFQVAAQISAARGWLSAEEVAQITLLLQGAGAPTTLPPGLDHDAILALMEEDNKRGYLPHRPGSYVMVLLEHLGQPALSQGLPLTYVTDAEVRAAMTALQLTAGSQNPVVFLGTTQEGAGYGD